MSILVCEEEKLKLNPLHGTLAALVGSAVLGAGSAFAAEQPEVEFTATPAMPIETSGVNASSPSNTFGQVTSVNQLRDVSPRDFAYNALRNLVERYGCIEGYPDGTFRGNTTLTRFEFAAALNACLQSIETIVATTPGGQPGEVSNEDLRTLYTLLEQFQGELTALGGRVDGLEGRVDELEANQFSTTTKLSGEVAFTVADSFGGNGGQTADDDDISETVFTGRLRLNFVSSFTGKDQLFVRLTSSTLDNSFQDELDTREGRFAFDVPNTAGVNVILDRLHYRFPVFDGLTAVVMPVLGAHHFYADVFNDGLNAGGGANGALSAFNERNPLYRLGISTPTVGVGFRYQPVDFIEASVGYLAPQGSNPADGNGLFDGSYSAMGQLVLKPFDGLRLGVNYIRNLDVNRGIFASTGTNLANFDDDQGPLLGLDFSQAVVSDSVGFQTQWDISSKFSVRGWFSFTDASLFGPEDVEGEILNWAALVVVKDIIKEGSLASLSFGAEPYLTDLEADGQEVDLEVVGDDIPFRLEGNYKFPLRSNISVTPGLIVLFSPSQNSDNDTVFIGAVRTTFTF